MKKRNTLNWKHTTKNHKAYGNYDGSKYETPFMMEEELGDEDEEEGKE